MNAMQFSLWQPRRIAILRALNLGDLLVAVPAFRALRRRFPKAEITLLGLPWAEVFVERYRCYLDRFVPFPGYPGIVEGDGTPEQIAQFMAQQQAYHYDLVIQMHGSGKTSNAAALELGGRVTAGYYPTERPEGLTIAAPYPEDKPEILRNLGLVALLGCSDLRPHLEFPVFADDYRVAATVLAELPDWQENQPREHSTKRPTVALHPGSRCPARRWPVTHFAALADELVERFDARILLTGNADEQAMAQHVIDAMHAPALNLAGRTSLGSLAGLISQVDLFISNDTGPAHIACALDCPSITIFGPAEFERWAPLDSVLHPAVRHAVACSPCGFWECPIDHRCLRWLTPHTVSGVAERLLHETAKNLDLAYPRQLSELPGAY